MIMCVMEWNEGSLLISHAKDRSPTHTHGGDACTRKLISDMYHKEIINTYIHTHAYTKVSHILKAPQRDKVFLFREMFNVLMKGEWLCT